MFGLRLSVSFLTFLLAATPARAQFSDIARDGISRVRIENRDFGYFFDDLRWPSGPDGATIIFVCWEGDIGVQFPREVKWVRSAVAESWQKHSRLEFRGWQKCAERNDGIRIAVQDVGPSVKHFGRNLNDVAEGLILNFSFVNWGAACRASEASRELCIKSITVHEFGHALGFAHEQDRADTPGECAAAHRTGTSGKNLVLLTPYDPSSVMNYCNPTYNNDGVLSNRDIQSVQQKYGIAVIGSTRSVFQGDFVAIFLPDGRNIRLIQPFSYVDSQGILWAVPSGEETDGASIPRAFWTTHPPFTGKYRAAAVIHDYYCRQRSRPWKDTHNVFYEAMRTSGVDERTATVMWAAVYNFGPRWGDGYERGGREPEASEQLEVLFLQKISNWIEKENPTREEIARAIDRRQIP